MNFDFAKLWKQQCVFTKCYDEMYQKFCTRKCKPVVVSVLMVIYFIPLKFTLIKTKITNG